MSCSSSAHAQHTILRGCCGKSCCPSVASYSAEPYCPCNDTAKNQAISYADKVCSILGNVSGFSGSYATFSVTLSNLDFSQITCGSFDIFVDDIFISKIATISNGTLTLGSQIPNHNIPYTIHINNRSNPSCATITITL